MDEHAPMKPMKVRTQQEIKIPWYDKEIENLKNEKNKYLKLFYLYRKRSDKEQSKRINKKLTHLKEKRKKTYYSDKLSQCEGDSKKEWNILRELTNGYTEKQDIEPENMNHTEANKYNSFFATVGSEVQKKLNIKDVTVKTRHRFSVKLVLYSSFFSLSFSRTLFYIIDVYFCEHQHIQSPSRVAC